MRFVRDSACIGAPGPDVVVTIGNFDGVHRGHQMILREVVARARARGGTATVMTFDPPPGRVVGRQSVPQIMSLTDRAATMAELGIDLFLCETFDRAFGEQPPEFFIEEILFRRLHPVAILVGYDFLFGRGRAGDVTLLRAFFEPKGVAVHQFAAQTWPDVGGSRWVIVSSSQIRRCLQEGDVEGAEAMLGRPYYLRGLIVKGEARGRQLGFPTANLRTENEQLLPYGVYATVSHIAGEEPLWGVTNIGQRPTFDGHLATIETHLFNFSGELYDRELRLEFVERLREEQRFEGVDALKVQIRKDVAAAVAAHEKRCA